MERRDIIMDQIEQFAHALGKIVAGFLGLKATMEANKVIEISNKRILDELQIDVDLLIHSRLEEVKLYIDQKQMAGENLEQLLDYLFECAIIADDEKKEAQLMRIRELYELVDELTRSASFDRMVKEQDIQNELKKLTSK